MTTELIKPTLNKTDNKDIVSLSPITLNDTYRQKFRINCNDFIVLTDNNGNQVNNSLYRRGGIFNWNRGKEQYFLLLKQVESKYSKEIMLSASKYTEYHNTTPNYLDNVECIVDCYGNEMYLSEVTFKHLTVIKNSCLFLSENKLSNIETLFCYGYNYSNKLIETDNYVITEVQDNYGSPRRVIKIKKTDGTFEKID